MREEELISLWNEVVDGEYQWERLSPGLRAAVKDYGHLAAAEGRVQLVKRQIEKRLARASGGSPRNDDS